MAAVLACCMNFDDKSPGKSPLLCKFIKVAHHMLLVFELVVQLWDLVLDAF